MLFEIGSHQVQDRYDQTVHFYRLIVAGVLLKN